MASFLVKHIVREQGPLASTLKSILARPYSFTNKEREARLAARGCNVYVIEVDVRSNQRVYRLGYRYKALDCFQAAATSLWKGRFKFKNSARHGLSAGVYFEQPVLFTDSDLNDWCRGETFGMAYIPEDHVTTLERLIADPVNKALPI